MNEKLNIETVRHSLSHIMAAAVLEMFPKTKLAIGPAIENGFYYDFDLEEKLTPEIVKKIYERICLFIVNDYKFVKREMPKKEAIEYLKKTNQPYKVEMAEEIDDDKISFYDMIDEKTGKIVFTDMCAGPHIDSTHIFGKTGVGLGFNRIAGAYWKGDEKNKMLQRIYFYAFSTIEEMQDFAKKMEEAEKRDHKKLGKELGLFVFSDLIGPGLPIYTPKGTIILQKIKNYSAELRRKIGYQEVQTPQINKADLFKKSGHYEKYKDNMFKVTSNYSTEEYYLKPMNCPQHTQVYASEQRSYKDLPVRIADFALLYRDEKPGELQGLARLRSFSQDDGHCFCREDQIGEEFQALLLAIKEAMKKYGLEYYIRLSLRGEENKEKFLGDDKVWQKSEKILEEILKKNDIEYEVGKGEAAFYGPKMDLMAKDSMGREWQLSTIQLDFNMPERFGLEYIGEDGKKYTPVMIHSAIVGSPERFLGVLIEHFAGAFPAWLAPVQAVILPISDKQIDYAKSIEEKLKDKNIRVEIDYRNESIGKKIRDAEMQKIPYMLVVGDKEIEAKKIALRKYGEGDKGQMDINTVIQEIIQ